MQVFKKESAIKTVKSSVIKSEQKVTDIAQNFKNSLTSSTIGAEEEDEQIKRGLSSEEKESYNNLPPWKKKGIRQRARQSGTMQKNINAQRAATLQKNKRNVVAAFGTAKSGERALAKGGAAATKGAASAGATAASGAATAGTTVAIAAVAESAKAAKREVRRIKAALESSIESSKERASKSEKKRFSLLQSQEKETKKDTAISGASITMTALFGTMIAGLIISLWIVMIIISALTPPDAIGADRIVEVAKRELEVSQENVGGKKYKIWYGMDDNWCAMFVSYCANECGYIDDGIMPRTASVGYMKAWYKKQDQYHEIDSGYEPKQGDIIIFGRGKSHTGIVVEYDPEERVVTTIEGNTGRSNTDPYHAGSHVKLQRYPLRYTYTDGFCSPDYPEEEDTESEDTE